MSFSKLLKKKCLFIFTFILAIPPKCLVHTCKLLLRIDVENAKRQEQAPIRTKGDSSPLLILLNNAFVMNKLPFISLSVAPIQLFDVAFLR